MQPIDQSRSSSLINKKVMEFIEKKDPKPWAAYYSLTETHTPLIVEPGFKGKSSHGDYGDTILQMDAMVGKVLDMLDSSGQAENTLVYYTSDHGGHIELGTRGGWNAPFTGGKANAAREGGVRVPGIVRWPAGGIVPGSQLTMPTSQMDHAHLVGGSRQACAC